MSLFNWQERPAAALVNGGVIAPDERLPWPQTAAMASRSLGFLTK